MPVPPPPIPPLPPEEPPLPEEEEGLSSGDESEYESDNDEEKERYAFYSHLQGFGLTERVGFTSPASSSVSGNVCSICM